MNQNAKKNPTKAQVLEGWKELTPDMPMLDKMRAIPYKSKGSKYGTCGIRIDGTPDFIDAVLSHLKELIGGENEDTRLQLSRTRVEPLEGHDFGNAETDAECCYIRLHERGNEAAMVNHIVNAMRKRKYAA